MPACSDSADHRLYILLTRNTPCTPQFGYESRLRVNRFLRSIPVSVQRARFGEAVTVLLNTLNNHHEGATSMVKSVWAIVAYTRLFLHILIASL